MTQKFAGVPIRTALLLGGALAASVLLYKNTQREVVIPEDGRPQRALTSFVETERGSAHLNIPEYWRVQPESISRDQLALIIERSNRDFSIRYVRTPQGIVKIVLLGNQIGQAINNIKKDLGYVGDTNASLQDCLSRGDFVTRNGAICLPFFQVGQQHYTLLPTGLPGTNPEDLRKRYDSLLTLAMTKDPNQRAYLK